MILKSKHHLGASIVYTGRLLTNSINNYFLSTGSNITFEQMRILMMLASHPEKKIIQNDLAVLIQKNKSGILRTIDILEKKYFVKRIPVVGDRRKNMIEVTAEGMTIAKAAITSFEKMEKEFMKKIKKEDLAACNKVLDIIKKECGPVVGTTEDCD